MSARIVLTLVALAFAATGCEEPGASAPAAHAMRIVSLSPATTQMILDLGMGDAIVGVGQHDAAAPPGARLVGTYTDVNLEALAAAAPTHVTLQVGIAGPPQVLLDMQAAGRFELAAYAYPDSIGDVADMISPGPEDDPSRPALGVVLGVPDVAADIRQRMLDRIDAIRLLTADRPRVRTLMVIGTNPVMASGGGTVLNEMLEIAGGLNVAPQNATAPTLDREKLLGLNPDVVLLLMPGAAPLTTMDDDHRLADLRGPGMTAYAAGRIHLIDDPQTLLPATSLPRIIARMAACLHPDLADELEAIP